MASLTFRDHQHLIGPNEWIWADSAYPVEAWCVTPYKKPASNIPANRHFNFWVSHVRIRSEHAVGLFKGRFQSLRGLRQQIKNDQDHCRALEWIRTCIVLHNLTLEIEHGSVVEESDWEEELIANGQDSEAASNSDSDIAANRRVSEHDARRESAGQRKRRKVKEALFHYKRPRLNDN